MNNKQLKERLVKLSLFICAAFSIIAVILIIGYLLDMGSTTIITFIQHGINVAFSGSAASTGTGPAIINDIDGTVYTALGGTALAVIIGVPCAIYMAEFSNMKLRNFAKTSLELLDGFPSVVIGIIGWSLLVSPQTQFTFTYFLGHLQSPPQNLNGAVLFAWLILMVMSFPVIATLSEDALRAVPHDLREASLGLGATKWQTTKEVLLPSAMPRVITAVLLALAAAMGEMVAINWVLRGTVPGALYHSPILVLNPLIDTQTLSISMENGYMSTGESTGVIPPNVFALGFLLFVMVGVINIAARMMMTKRSNRVTE